MSEAPVLIEARNISKRFSSGNAGLKRFFNGGGAAQDRPAVDDVSLQVRQGEMVGIVGVSGSGKSTLGRIICGLLSQTSGSVDYHPDVAERGDTKRPGLAIQMVFQNPFASLNPRRRVWQTVAEPMRVHGLVPPAAVTDAAFEMLHRTGLSASLSERYPGQLSGGQCQRVGIARALAVKPKVLVCDEPVSALDVSVQAQVLNLLADLNEQLNVASLFISHDLSVVERVCSRVLVMRQGRVVEEGDCATIFSGPKHSYTQQLIAAIPTLPKHLASTLDMGSEQNGHAG